MSKLSDIVTFSWLGKKKFEWDGQPAYCKKCGQLLVASTRPTKFDGRSGKPSRRLVKVACPVVVIPGGYDHTCYVWEEDISDAD